MQTINDVHQQFAEFFKSDLLKPFAFLVSKKLAEGSICLDLDDVIEELASNAFYADHKVEPASLLHEPFVATSESEKQPFVLHNHKLYLQRYFNYETQIIQRLNLFAESEKEQLALRETALRKQVDFIRSMFENKLAVTGKNPTEKINWQLVASITGVLNDFTIITGGPGTGKTTTVATILAILYTINPLLKVALAAPTGKAAVRMADSLKSSSKHMPAAINARFQTITPVTIHRLLKPVRDTPYFKQDKDNPLNEDVIIVDESSMIDAALLAKLMNATGAGTKLILLGDKDQLASVEAGSLFGDLCKTQSFFQLSAGRASLVNSFISDPSRQINKEMIAEGNGHVLFEHIVELKESHRFSNDKGIGKYSKAIITGDQEQLNAFLKNKDDQVIIDTGYDEKIFEQFIESYASYIREPDINRALEQLNNLRVLCAVREGEKGTYALNRKIEKYLHQKKLIKAGKEFYENRPVIITRNYYDYNLFNGDVGIIRSDENGVLKAWFEDASGETKSVLPGFISEAETVFAMTIHKSQGSEYDQVLIVLPDVADMPLLTAELLYTGVTRAKVKVIVQAAENVILETSKRRVKRASGIIERFRE